MITQETLDTDCETTKRKYLALTERDAAEKFAVEMQGWVASVVHRMDCDSQIENHQAIEFALARVTDLARLIRKANYG